MACAVRKPVRRQHLLELVNNHFPGSHFRRPLHVPGQILLHPARGCARRLFRAAAVMEEAEGDDGVVARVHQVIGHKARRLLDERHKALFGKAHNLIQIADILDAIASYHGIHDGYFLSALLSSRKYSLLTMRAIRCAPTLNTRYCSFAITVALHFLCLFLLYSPARKNGSRDTQPKQERGSSPDTSRSSSHAERQQALSPE